MIDKILKILGLAKLSSLEIMYDGFEEALYDSRQTYDFIEGLLEHELPAEVKIKINNYLLEHEWLEKNVHIIYSEEEN